MSLTREVLSISPITLADAYELRLSVQTINPLKIKDDDKSFLGRFFTECASSGRYYIEKGPWEVSSIGINGAENKRCIHFTSPIILRPSASYVTHLRAEVMGGEIGFGTYGRVHKALATLAIPVNGEVVVKEKLRIIKEQPHRKTKLREIERESEMGIQAGYLHMKAPIHIEGKSFTVSRYFANTVELFDVLNNLYLRPGCYPTDKILRIAVNLLKALKYQLHDRGIISRDIKPENILVDLATDDVFNIDLGLSRFINEFDHKESVGSLGYLSPEVFSKSGMSVKSDIFSLGVVISLLLGARENDDLRSNGHRTVTLPDLKHLFDHVADLDSSERKALSAMLQSMMALNPDDRMPLDQAILIVEDIILNRQPAAAPESTRDGLKQAYRLAVMVRDELDLAAAAMRAYSSMDPFTAMDALADKLKGIAASGLDLLPDEPEAIKLFAITLQSKRFSALTTKADMKAMIEADITSYAARKAELEACRHQLADCLNSEGGLGEGFSLAQQELGLIITALHYRVRSLAPVIDNLPILAGKMDKCIRELGQLRGYIDEGLLAEAKTDKKLPNIGLFCSSPRRFKGGCQGQNDFISMKNI